MASACVKCEISFFLRVLFFFFQLAQSLTTARQRLETRLEQAHGFEREIDSLTDWLTQFIEEQHDIQVDQIEDPSH